MDEFPGSNMETENTEEPSMPSDDAPLTDDPSPANGPALPPETTKPPHTSTRASRRKIGQREAAEKAAAMLKGLNAMSSEPSKKRKNRSKAAEVSERPAKLPRTREPDIPLIPMVSVLLKKSRSDVPELPPIDEDPPETEGGFQMRLFFIDRERRPMEYEFKPPKQTVS
jgi:hypothetical protein